MQVSVGVRDSMTLLVVGSENRGKHASKRALAMAEGLRLAEFSALTLVDFPPDRTRYDDGDRVIGNKRQRHPSDLPDVGGRPKRARLR